MNYYPKGDHVLLKPNQDKEDDLDGLKLCRVISFGTHVKGLKVDEMVYVETHDFSLVPKSDLVVVRDSDIKIIVQG